MHALRIEGKKKFHAEGVEKLYQVNMCTKSNSLLTNLFVQRDAKKSKHFKLKITLHLDALLYAVNKYDKCLHEMYITDLCY
jgi:hypothetical protein